MKKLNPLELDELDIGLYYFHVEELKEVCFHFQLSSSGKKCDLIDRILAYVKWGEKQELTPMPKTSKAEKGVSYPLDPKTKIVIGAYKNDLATRLFFKKLIGSHFHFTAFGIDWINQQWREGKPPTYEEFACFWQKEHEIRKIQKVMPKKEWAYLNFIKRSSIEQPHLSKEEITKAWEEERGEYVQKARALLF